MVDIFPEMVDNSLNFILSKSLNYEDFFVSLNKVLPLKNKNKFVFILYSLRLIVPLQSGILKLYNHEEDYYIIFYYSLPDALF